MSHTKYMRGKLTINIDYLLDDMSDHDKLDLAHRLSCEDAIIQHVVDQITLGSTDDGSSGSRIYPPQATPYAALDKAARQIAKASSEISEEEITRLEKHIQRLEKTLLELRQEMADMRPRGIY